LDKKKIATNLGLLLVSLVICVILLEVIVRILIVGQAGFVLCAYEEDHVAGYRLQAGFETSYVPGSREYEHLVKTNSRGERGDDFGISGAETVILGVGDSFAFGLGVDEEETYLRLLEKSLREKGKSVVAVNAAVNGYSTEQELDLMEEYLEKYDVDLVVIGFFSANDVYGNLENKFRYEIVEGCLQTKPVEGTRSESIVQGMRNFLSNNFKSYGFFAERLRAVPVLRELLMGLGLMQGKRAPPHLQSMQNPPDDFMETAWVATEAEFERAQAIAESHNVRVVFLDIPSNFQIEDGLREQALGTYGVPVEEYEFDFPEKKLREILRGKDNIIFIDTVQDFRQSTEKTYYNKDPHWTVAGHELAAQILEEEILERKLI
tara:strand:+ start:2881 stop:4011 length:1131 start_codon:yes stop_codon:yes gene_type:complete